MVGETPLWCSPADGQSFTRRRRGSDWRIEDAYQVKVKPETVVVATYFNEGFDCCGGSDPNCSRR